MKKKIIITCHVPEKIIKPFKNFFDFKISEPGYQPMSRFEVLSTKGRIEGIINSAELKIDQEILNNFPYLKIVSNISIGTDNLDLNLLTKKKIWATNTPKSFVESTADCTIAFILILARKLRIADIYVRDNSWPEDGFTPGKWDGDLLFGKTLGIIGYGNIGKAVAKRAKSFGMNIIYNKENFSRSKYYRPLDELLKNSDFITLHAPLTNKTYHLLNSKNLKFIKKDSYLINMSRGKLIAENDLINFIKLKKIAGVALDVFEFEPLVNPELLNFKNVFLTPHLGGGTIESRLEALELCLQNQKRVLNNLRPLTPVNLV
jgi:glyoxylate reductase